MLELGIELSSKIEVEIVDGKKIFNVNDGKLIACFDENITNETVKTIAKQTPEYVYFRDSGMANDSVMINYEQIFNFYSPKTVRKIL